MAQPLLLNKECKGKKRKLKRRLYGRTKPGTLLRHKIPVKTEHWDVKRPGFTEADLVSQSGSSGHGEFIYSLKITDIFTGWVETQAVMGKGQRGILEALESISERVPFRILGIDSDNVLNLESSFFFGYTDPIISNSINQAMSKWLPL